MDKQTILTQIGQRIREIRESKGISQQDLAAGCNFEKSNMSRIEAGHSNLTVGTLVKICQVLKINLSDVIKEI